MRAVEEERASRLRIAAVLAGIVLLAFQLRGPLVSLASLARPAEAGWGISAATLGLLTTVPLLCFGLSTPLAPILARRIGLEASILVCLTGVVAATALRPIGGFGIAVAASVLLGLSVTIGNVLVPTVIRRDVPSRRRGIATGVFSVGINVGTMLTSVATVPIAGVVGWRAATAAWAVVGVATIAVWFAILHGVGRGSSPARGPSRGPLPAPGPSRLPRVSGLAILLGLAFSAQSFSYYSVTTWLPSLLADERGYSAATAGSASGVFQLAGAVGGMGVPLLSLRLPPRTVIAVVGLLWMSLPVGLLVAPEQFLVVSVLGGMAQGGGFAAIFTIIAEVGGDARGTTALSAFVQTVGYLVAAAAPPVVGGVHELTGGWTAPMLLVVATTTGFLVFGVVAATLASRRGGPA